jgi:hypothetical protein
MKKIAAHQYKIDRFIDRIPLQNIHPGVEKVTGTLG